MKFALSILAAVLLCVAARAGGEENPYAKAKVGDWAKYKVTETKTPKDGAPVTNAREVKFTVVATNTEKKEVSVDSELVQSDGTLKKVGTETVKLTDKFDPFKTAARPPKMETEIAVGKEGDEQIDVSGKKVASHWTEAQVVIKGRGAWSNFKLWRSADVPLSGKVKSHQEMAKTVVDWELVGFGGAKPAAAAASAATPKAGG